MENNEKEATVRELLANPNTSSQKREVLNKVLEIQGDKILDYEVLGYDEDYVRNINDFFYFPYQAIPQEVKALTRMYQSVTFSAYYSEEYAFTVNGKDFRNYFLQFFYKKIPYQNYEDSEEEKINSNYTYYSYKKIRKILKHIKQAIKIIGKYYNNEWIKPALMQKEMIKNESDKEIIHCNKVEKETIINFYKKFIQDMEYIMTDPKNKKEQHIILTNVKSEI